MLTVSIPWLYTGLYAIKLAILNKVRYHNVRDSRGRFTKYVPLSITELSEKWKEILNYV